jgi:hypothetical protein
MSEAQTWTTIGELKSLGLTKAKMEYKNQGMDTSYMLFMKDVRKHPETISLFILRELMIPSINCMMY